jgi:predicted CxxxxCH...CXXCH cytochrome family protein
MKILQLVIVLLFTATLWGCGKGNPNASLTIDPVTQKHAAGWAANGDGGAHPAAYFAAPASCKECHGEPTDKLGGISGVSCSNQGRSGVACHASFPHVAGFAAFAVHGSVAKDIAGGVTGMAHCQKCHGSSYTGDVGPSCIACHKGTNPASNAPHAANWVTGNANGLKHSATHVSNAAACAQCHLGGANTPTSLKAHTPPAGLAPDCFNNTLCHAEAGHALPYVTGHQAAAKANLSSCLPSCHATAAPAGVNPRYNQIKGTGVLSTAGCEGCHNKPGIAHPFMWLPGRGTTNGAPNATSHSAAGSVNGSCGLCHGGTALTGGSVAYPGGIAPPSCFSTPASLISGTACHFTKPVDAQGADVGCGSCHGAIPQVVPNGLPSGTVAPNRAFRHTNHFATATFNLAGLTCSACHTGVGSPATTHSTRVVFAAITAAVAIDPKFNENGLTATYSTTTQRCTNVSCHGGKNLSPLWKNAAVFNQALCLNCHTQQAAGGAIPSAYAGPYIGPFSGNQVPDLSGNNLHNTHLFLFNATNPALVCLKCHTAPGVGHYANIMLGKRLLTPGFAAGTIGGTGIVSYTFNNTTPATSSCVTIAPAPAGECHIDAPNPRSWY